jgi:hypothetical protein
MKNTFLILILIFVSGGFIKSTANEIFIADTTLNRYYSATIRVQGSLDSPANSVKITLKYNPNQLRIIGVASDTNNIFMDSGPVFNKIEIDSITDKVEIESNNIKSDGKYFFNIILQAMIDKDSIFILEPVDLTLDGVSSTANFTAGHFLVKNLIEETKKTGIGYPYPNPFPRVMNLEFNLMNDEYVTITIYDAFGRLVSVIDKDYDRYEFPFLDYKRETITFNPEEKLKAGRYFLNWYPQKELWATTAYYIVFNIGGEIYHTTVKLER